MSDQTVETSLIDLVDEFFGAYNRVNRETLRRLLDPDVHWEHHNHFSGDGTEGLIELIEKIAKMVPERSFTPASRVNQIGAMVYREHSWSGTPWEKSEGFPWEPGIEMTLETMSVFVFSDARITEWSDYA